MISLEFSVENRKLMVCVIFIIAFSFAIFRGLIMSTIGRSFIYPRLELKVVRVLEAKILSSLHAFLAVPLVVVFFMKKEYSRDHLLFHPSLAITLLCAYNVGYMLYDLCFLTFSKFVKGNDEKEYWLFVGHHIMAGTSSLLIVLLKEYHLGAVCMLSTEVTTLYVNNITFLPLLGVSKTSPLYIGNALTIVVTWVIFRFYVAMYLMVHIQIINWSEYIKRPLWQMVYWDFMQLFFFVLNVFWFYKVITGFLRILKKKKKEE